MSHTHFRSICALGKVFHTHAEHIMPPLPEHPTLNLRVNPRRPSITHPSPYQTIIRTKVLLDSCHATFHMKIACFLPQLHIQEKSARAWSALFPVHFNFYKHEATHLYQHRHIDTDIKGIYVGGGCAHSNCVFFFVANDNKMGELFLTNMLSVPCCRAICGRKWSRQISGLTTPRIIHADMLYTVWMCLQ